MSNGVSPLGTCYEDIDGIAGDLSGAFDCSVIDSEVVTEYCHNNLQVSRELRRYSSGSEDCQPSSDEEKEKDRLSTLSYDSIVKNRDSFISTDPEGPQSDFGSVDDVEKTKRLNAHENEPLVSDSDSKQNLINGFVTRVITKRNGIRLPNGKKYSPSLENISSYEEEKSDDKINVSTPNLKYKGSAKCSEKDPSKNSGVVLQLSLPNISATEEGCQTDPSVPQSPDNVFPKGSKLKRLRSDVIVQIDPHRFDLSSSEC